MNPNRHSKSYYKNVDIWTQELLEKTPILQHKLDALCIETTSTTELLTEVLKFLSLVSYSNQKLTPALNVDLAWHEFILFTRVYQDFCHEKFGRFIHHTPDSNTNNNQRNYQKTIQTYIHVFGAPPKAIWGDFAHNEWLESQCGTCNSN